jgi:hypothetical protein
LWFSSLRKIMLQVSHDDSMPCALVATVSSKVSEMDVVKGALVVRGAAHRSLSAEVDC